VPGEPNQEAYCGNCASFLFEDVCGLGWCETLRLTGRCDLPACCLWAQKPESTPIEKA
jgi:hypothetical protein